jgi:UBX domain-containing protein 1
MCIEGHTLDSEEKETSPPPATRIPGAFQTESNEEDGGAEDDLAVRTLHLWRNGFSIEDGPLMTYDDPKNKEILETLNSGFVPSTIAHFTSGG